MLAHPAWLGPDEQWRIEQALMAHDAPWDAEGNWFGRRYPSETAAVEAVLAILAVIIATVQARQDQPVGVRQRAADNYLEQIIDWAGRRLPDRARRDAVAIVVRQQFHTQPWWRQVHAPAVPKLRTRKPQGRSQTAPPRGSFTRQAAWLAQQLRLAGNVTPNRLEDLGGPDGKTTKRLLQGHGSRDDVLHKVVEGLNEANRRAQRKVVLTLRDIPQD